MADTRSSSSPPWLRGSSMPEAPGLAQLGDQVEGHPAVRLGLGRPRRQARGEIGDGRQQGRRRVGSGGERCDHRVLLAGGSAGRPLRLRPYGAARPAPHRANCAIAAAAAMGHPVYERAEHEVVFVGVGGRRGARRQPELGEDVAQVPGHGLVADVQLGRHRPVRAARRPPGRAPGAPGSVSAPRGRGDPGAGQRGAGAGRVRRRAEPLEGGQRRAQLELGAVVVAEGAGRPRAASARVRADS